MGKKILLAVFGGIAVLGLAVAIVGFALGGRPGSIQAENGNFIYKTSNDVVTLGKAPSWAGNWRMNVFGPALTYREDEPQAAADTGRSGYDHSLAEPARGGSGTPAELGFTADAVKSLDIDIAAGYVEVKTGDKLSLTVDGRMEYGTWLEEGTWHIESEVKGISEGWSNLWDRQGFWWNGEDITTTFIITLPAGTALGELELDLDMGEASVRDITVQELDVTTDMGGVTVQDVVAAEASLDVNMGSITTSNLAAGALELDCDMGEIVMHGEVGTILDAECSMGSIQVVLPRPEHYTVDASASMGNVSVDGHHRSGHHEEGHNGAAGVHMELACGMGSIDVSFS